MWKEKQSGQAGVSRSTKFTMLLFAIVVVTLLHGLARQLDTGHLPVELATLVVNAVGLYAVCRVRRHLLVGGALMLCAMGAILINLATGTSQAHWIALDAAASAVLMAYFVVRILLDIFDRHRVAGGEILGSICAYMLLAISWASVFGFVQVFVPDAFAVGGQVVEQLSEHRLVYFGFVTLSTLGYGDLTPAAPIMQDLAALAAVSGVFYLATLVAVLVSRSLAKDPDTSEQR